MHAPHRHVYFWRGWRTIRKERSTRSISSASSYWPVISCSPPPHLGHVRSGSSSVWTTAIWGSARCARGPWPGRGGRSAAPAWLSSTRGRFSEDGPNSARVPPLPSGRAHRRNRELPLGLLRSTRKTTRRAPSSVGGCMTWRENSPRPSPPRRHSCGGQDRAQQGVAARDHRLREVDDGAVALVVVAAADLAACLPGRAVAPSRS